jgi:hypothetical protein
LIKQNAVYDNTNILTLLPLQRNVSLEVGERKDKRKEKKLITQEGESQSFSWEEL